MSGISQPTTLVAKNFSSNITGNKITRTSVAADTALSAAQLVSGLLVVDTSVAGRTITFPVASTFKTALESQGIKFEVGYLGSMVIANSPGGNAVTIAVAGGGTIVAPAATGIATTITRTIYYYVANADPTQANSVLLY